MTRKKIPSEIARMSNLKIEVDTEENIQIATEINTIEGLIFRDPSIVEKSLFIGKNETISPDGESLFYTLTTNKAYVYALISALLKKSNDELAKRAPEEKEEEPEDLSKHPKVREAFDKWKEENGDDDKYVKETAVISPATRFYSGKNGVQIAELAGLNQLTDKELLSIVAVCNNAKGDISKELKKDKNNPWLSIRKGYKPEGWRAIQIVKFNAMRDNKLISDDVYEKKMEWATTFDFHDGWNFENKEEKTQIEVEKLTEKTINIMAAFNDEFCAAAINRDELLIRIEE